MLVKTLLDSKPREVITTEASTTVDAAMELLIQHNISCLPIVEGGEHLVGIITDRDIFRRIHETKGDYHGLKVDDLMIRDVLVGLPTDQVSYIAGIMDKNWIRHVPIVEGDRLVGLVSQRDIIRMESDNHAIENRYLNLYLEGMHHRDMSGEH